jgi:hypothetical protein
MVFESTRNKSILVILNTNLKINFTVKYCIQVGIIVNINIDQVNNSLLNIKLKWVKKSKTGYFLLKQQVFKNGIPLS